MVVPSGIGGDAEKSPLPLIQRPRSPILFRTQDDRCPVLDDRRRVITSMNSRSPDPAEWQIEPAPMDEMARLKGIIDRLRSPGGCPWDLQQTPETLRPFLLEEAHEAAEAISGADPVKICEELGDLLMNIHLQARIAEEHGQFTLEQLAEGISAKLIRRHPHVFGDGEAKDSAAVRRNWDRIKQQEKGEEEGRPATIRPLPASLPALSRADRVGKMVAEVGFDWPDVDGALGKVEEELAELKEAIDSGDREAIGHELGDLFFAASSVSRKLDFDGEQALIDALERFRQRFKEVDTQLDQRRSQPEQKFELEQLEEWYQQGKSQQREPRSSETEENSKVGPDGD